MEEIISFLQAHWTEWLFTAALAVLSWAFRGVRAQLREEHDRNEAIAAGVQSLLRESIVSGYNRYSDKGFCPIYAKESIKRVYASYHDLGGNDVSGTAAHGFIIGGLINLQHRIFPPHIQKIKGNFH